ncbi:restriction endonuclease subunit S [Novosphingobium aerophilum]|uniref:Restriction endonuclease subunit S n=1 Tax=Novosphingobium aerophilum TaxID=2839843 RepID=A0A7X1F6L1_9SPHN|nr:restriction endonuclease subunit S [Novosphingobium aerophilum]MBC2651355.1 restriction endonuclease subunit S [Novosphingobium aerophilum]
MSSDVAELERPTDSLPDGWRSFRLGDVADISRGTSWGSDNERRDPVDGALPVLGIRNVQARLEIDDLLWLHGLKPSAIASSTVQTGDILMVGSNGNPARIGNAVQVDEPGRYLYASLLFGLRPRREAVDPDFLYFAVVAPGVQTAISDAVQGTTGLSNLKITTLRDLPIDLPPLDEQRRIAEVLRSVDEAIAAADAVASSLLRASKTMRHDLLNVAPDGTVIDLPPDWTVLPLEALASVERGKFSIRPRNDPRYFGGSTPFIQTGDITAAGDYITRHTQTLNDLGVGVSRVFAAGTIMTTIAANIGDFAIAAYPVACPDSVVGIEANPDVNPFWLYSVLTCFKAALDRAATQNAQKNINLQTLRPLQIPVPPPSVMIELAETLAAAADVAMQAKASVANLTATKQALMSDLLSGRVRVPA